MLNELRLAARRLRREPGFAAAVVTVLALAIGANTAIVSIVDGVLLRPAPFDDLDSLVVVWETDRHSGPTRELASVPDFLDYRARSRTLGRLEALLATEVNLTGPAGDPVRLAALRVSHGFLPALGLRPSLGRGFAADEDRPDGPRVALVSARISREAFGADPGVIGRTVRLDDEPWSVIGVMPEPTSARCRCSRRQPTRGRGPTAATACRWTSGCRCRPTSRRCRARRIPSS